MNHIGETDNLLTESENEGEEDEEETESEESKQMQSKLENRKHRNSDVVQKNKIQASSGFLDSSLENTKPAKNNISASFASSKNENNSSAFPTIMMKTDNSKHLINEESGILLFH